MRPWATGGATSASTADARSPAASRTRASVTCGVKRRDSRGTPTWARRPLISVSRAATASDAAVSPSHNARGAPRVGNAPTSPSANAKGGLVEGRTEDVSNCGRHVVVHLTDEPDRDMHAFGSDPGQARARRNVRDPLPQLARDRVGGDHDGRREFEGDEQTHRFWRTCKVRPTVLRTRRFALHVAGLTTRAVIRSVMARRATSGGPCRARPATPGTSPVRARPRNGTRVIVSRGR